MFNWVPILPIAAPRKQSCQVFEILLVDFVETIDYRAVDVDNSHHALLFAGTRVAKDGHYNLTPAVPIASNVAWKLVYVPDQLRRLRLRRSSTDPSAKGNRLASNFALKWAQNKLRLSRRRIPNVEALRVASVAAIVIKATALDSPAQFTSLLGAGKDLYACHSKDAALARLLYKCQSLNSWKSTTLEHTRPICSHTHVSCHEEPLGWDRGRLYPVPLTVKKTLSLEQHLLIGLLLTHSLSEVGGVGMNLIIVSLYSATKATEQLGISPS